MSPTPNPEEQTSKPSEETIRRPVVPTPDETDKDSDRSPGKTDRSPGKTDRGVVVPTPEKDAE